MSLLLCIKQRHHFEHEFIQDLRNQGYEYLPDLNTPEALFANVRTQLQVLNDVEFTDSEWGEIFRRIS